MSEQERTPEEQQEANRILLTRGKALAWARNGNMETVKAEYRRRIDRGERIMMAWRRALWVCYKNRKKK